MLVSLASAKGAPGVTTSAHLLAALWPRPVIMAELDPAGSDLLYRSRTAQGLPLDADRGVVSLAAAVRREPKAPVAEHLTTIDGGLEVLLGLSRPDQAAAIGAGWAALAACLRSHGDVVADVGRIAPGAPSLGVALASDLTILVTRPGVENYGHLRERLSWIINDTAHRSEQVRLGVILIAPWKSRHEGADLSRLLQASGFNVPVLGVLAHDPAAADALAGRRPRPLGRTMLVRSGRTLTANLAGGARSGGSR
ncbi:hypothetical protein ACSL103130_11205 [Actinomyces slackii]|uniref:Flp pilus assembly protein, ATPase CpaE n=1 Tax=Actinomyces slackii TaxID=52774 RepID=A0A3S4SP25_9ACTO|nr:hypothetical protein [Actinomyces slackii]VEG74573.1 Uncharacterised protein [Actinomyces slackii]